MDMFIFHVKRPLFVLDIISDQDNKISGNNEHTNGPIIRKIFILVISELSKEYELLNPSILIIL
jgi:hypothetical protein